jgi:hypothetical protein
MTEQQWLQATDPQPMLEYLQGKVSDRKLRLFAVAACRRASRLLFPAGRAEAFLEIIERYADGSASKGEVIACHSGMLPSPVSEQTDELEVPLWWWMTRDMLKGGVRNIAVVADWIAQTLRASANDSHTALHASAGDEIRASRSAWAEANLAMSGERAFQCYCLRDLFGPLPFRPVVLDSGWLTWHDGLLVSMARQMYDSRDFRDLPVLADALEEAGCTNRDILGHCRSGGEHVRGCWVVDAILGRS